MLASSQHGGVCIKCAFRLRMRLLQHQRSRSRYATTAADQSPVDGNGEQTFQHIGRPVKRASDEDGAPRFRGWKVASDDGRQRKEGGAENARKSGGSGKAGVKRISREFTDKREMAQSGPTIHKYNASLSKLPGRNAEQLFRDSLDGRLKKVKLEVEHAPVLEQVAKEKAEWDGQEKQETFGKLWRQFVSKIMPSGANGKNPSHDSAPEDTGLFSDLLHVFREKGPNGLEERMKYHFYGHVTGSRFTESDIRNQKNMADLRYPSEWFPATRAIHRTVHLHVGPTNSGKTYRALQRLEQAKSGVYAGPLRLLAHEVFTRLNAKGRRCALLTGEERRAPPDHADGTGYDLTACTVEMTPLVQQYDVAVVDEIQMIGDADRGWAWTQAFLGVMAKEVHLCGEERTVPLIKELCASVGEKLEIHRYQRLSPLQMAEQSLDGDLRRLRKGDCIISFSVMGIHALRKQIEKSTGRKVATVYGSLPPETRAQQARLFNDPNNDYDYLVASDAVGMGLNLAIKRIVFETSTKFNGVQRHTLSIADIKQIGGRAGRFRTAAQAAEAPVSEADLAAAKGESPPGEQPSHDDTPDNVGLVTTLERFDFPIIRTAMSSEPEPIKSAGLFPPGAILERFAGYFPPGTPFSYVIARLHELSQMHTRFHLCGLKDQIWIADIVEGVQGLSISDRNILASCPANRSDADFWMKLMPAYARCIASQDGGDITQIEELPLEILDAEIQGTREYLRALEQLHKGVVGYLWLSYRFAGVFTTRVLAMHVKKIVEDRIEKTLSQFSFSESQRRLHAHRREQEVLAKLMQGTDETVSIQTATDEKDEDDVEEEDEQRVAESTAAQQAEVESEVAYHEEGIGSELEGKDSSAAIAQPDLSAQTSQIGGGDHFAGEELGLDEPGLEPEGADEDTRTPSEEVQVEIEQKPKEAVSGSL